MKVDKNLLYSNIKLKISETNKKIGDVEVEAGMTAGYLSKLQKDDAKNNNILDFIVSVSEILGISVDSLVHVDYSSLTKTERYFADFIDKLIRETTEGVLCWNKETVETLNDFYYQSEHPLFVPDEIHGDTYEPKSFKYNSLFESGVNISSDCYNVEINGSTLYLMNTYSKNEPFGVELYFVKPVDYEQSNVIKICQIGVNSPLEKLGGDLNAAAKESSNHIKLDNNAKSIIDDFMNDIPF